MNGWMDRVGERAYIVACQRELFQQLKLCQSLEIDNVILTEKEFPTVLLHDIWESVNMSSCGEIEDNSFPIHALPTKLRRNLCRPSTAQEGRNITNDEQGMSTHTEA
jgi:hypothetical protein